MAKTLAGVTRDALKRYLRAAFDSRNYIDCGHDILKEIEKIPKEQQGPRLAKLASDLTDVVMLGDSH